MKKTYEIKTEKNIPIYKKHNDITNFTTYPKYSPHYYNILTSHPQPTNTIIKLLLLQNHKI